MPITVSTLIEAYKTERLGQCAPETKRSYDRVFRRACEAYGHVEAPAVKPADWLKPWAGAGPGAAKQASVILRALCAFGGLEPPPRIKHKPTPHRRLSDSEVRTLLAQDDDVAPLIHLGLQSGLRIGDALAAAGRSGAVASSKTGVETPLPEMARGVKVRWSSPAYAAKKVNARIKLAGVDATFHSLRKTAACLVAEAGGSDAEIMAVLGHKTAKMAAEYRAQANRAQLAEVAQGRLQLAIARVMAGPTPLPRPGAPQKPMRQTRGE